MPIEIDDATGEVIREWDWSDDDITRLIDDFNKQFPGLLEKLGDL